MVVRRTYIAIRICDTVFSPPLFFTSGMKILFHTIVVVVSTFVPGVVFVCVVLSNRISSGKDQYAIYTDADVGLVLVAGTITSSLSPLILSTESHRFY